MRILTVFAALSAYLISGGTADLPNLPEYVKKLPDCSVGALQEATKDAGCKVEGVNSSTFECICDHIGSISLSVNRKVELGCSADFTIPISGICSTFMISSTKSELDEATKILEEKFNGKGDSDTKEGAAYVAQVPYSVGLVGGAVALLAGYLI